MRKKCVLSSVLNMAGLAAAQRQVAVSSMEQVRHARRRVLQMVRSHGVTYILAMLGTETSP